MSAAPPHRIGVEINPYVIGGTEAFLSTLFAQLDPAPFQPVALAAEHGPCSDDFGRIVETHEPRNGYGVPPISSRTLSTVHRSIEIH